MWSGGEARMPLYKSAVIFKCFLTLLLCVWFSVSQLHLSSWHNLETDMVLFLCCCFFSRTAMLMKEYLFSRFLQWCPIKPLWNLVLAMRSSTVNNGCAFSLVMLSQTFAQAAQNRIKCIDPTEGDLDVPPVQIDQSERKWHWLCLNCPECGARGLVCCAKKTTTCE